MTSKFMFVVFQVQKQLVAGIVFFLISPFSTKLYIKNKPNLETNQHFFFSTRHEKILFCTSIHGNTMSIIPIEILFHSTHSYCMTHKFNNNYVPPATAVPNAFLILIFQTIKHQIIFHDSIIYKSISIMIR